MLQNYVNYPRFHRGQHVISIAYHPPEIHPGTMGVIVSPWRGSLYAIEHNGEIHTWFAGFELAPVNPFSGPLAEGSYARIIFNMGHGNPPHIPVGTVVRIVRRIPNAIFYDLMVHGTEYHRWLAEFELALPLS